MSGKNTVSPDNVVTLDDDRAAMSEVRDALISSRYGRPIRC